MSSTGGERTWLLSVGTEIWQQVQDLFENAERFPHMRFAVYPPGAANCSITCPVDYRSHAGVLGFELSLQNWTPGDATYLRAELEQWFQGEETVHQLQDLLVRKHAGEQHGAWFTTPSVCDRYQSGDDLPAERQEVARGSAYKTPILFRYCPLGALPSEAVLDSSWYIRKYPDLPQNGVRNDRHARQHWVAYGALERRYASEAHLLSHKPRSGVLVLSADAPIQMPKVTPPTPQAQPPQALQAPPQAPPPKLPAPLAPQAPPTPPAPQAQPPSLAVMLHLGNINLWGYFEEKIRCIQQPFDLYVTLVRGFNATPAQLEAAKQRIAASFPQQMVCVSQVENRGQDVGGFMLALLEARQRGKRYDWVLKLHTKSSDLLRDRLVKPLVGSAEAFQRCQKLMQDQGVGSIGATSQIMEAVKGKDLDVKAIQQIQQLAVAYHLRPQRWSFVAGTCFFIRGSLLDQWERQSNIPAIVAGMSTGYSTGGTLAHAYERFFGVLTHASGYRLEGV